MNERLRRRYANMVGLMYGHWQVIGIVEHDVNRNLVVPCRCTKCGRTGRPHVQSIVRGSSVQCAACAQTKKPEQPKFADASAHRSDHDRIRHVDRLSMGPERRRVNRLVVDLDERHVPALLAFLEKLS